MGATATIAGLLLVALDGGTPRLAPPGEPAAAVTSVELRVPELRLLDGEVRLQLNSGWALARAGGGPAPAAPERAIDGEIDLANRRGRIRLGGGDERRLRLRVEWDFRVDDDMARVHSRIDMALFGKRLILSPPDVRVRPRFDHGGPGVEVNVPLLEGRF
jgi:hypothetical protein